VKRLVYFIEALEEMGELQKRRNLTLDNQQKAVFLDKSSL